jgi:hypothetical protein
MLSIFTPVIVFFGTFFVMVVVSTLFLDLLPQSSMLPQSLLVFDLIIAAIASAIIMKLCLRKPKPCGNPKCDVSRNPAGHLSFGSGRLESGSWEKPCAICARAHEKEYPKDGPCYPYSDEFLRKLGLKL